jgi:hypothetical protein
MPQAFSFSFFSFQFFYKKNNLLSSFEALITIVLAQKM